MSKVSSGLQRGIEGFKESSKGSKRFRRGLKDVGDFEGGFKGFEGVSHDSGQTANLTVSNLHDLGTHELGHVYMAVGSFPGAEDILLDSAATSHMFCDHHLFTNYVPSTDNETVAVGDQHPLKVAGQGSVSFRN